jgi:hypothetical protein
MPIVGFSLSSMEAKRTAMPSGEIKINSSPKVMSMKEAEVASLGKNALSLEFEFVTEYDPNIGTIKLTGELIYVDDDSDKVLEQWKRNKTLPEDVSIEVLNQLFRKCILRSSEMAEDLQLPLPMQMPRVVAKPKDAKQEKGKDSKGKK